MSDWDDADAEEAEVLAVVSRAGDVAAISRLLDGEGRFVDERDAEGATPLIAACFGASAAAVALLLARGADVDAVQEAHSWTPIIAASYVGAADCLRLVLAHAPAPTTLRHVDLYGKTAADYVAEALGELRRATQLDPGNQRFKYVYDVARSELR